ncbi:MAG: hypothetical protein H6601_06790 [Flavobacteriales bacterium]|nr:hypothetical protein [Flavobacteriales bacterium]
MKTIKISWKLERREFIRWIQARATAKKLKGCRKNRSKSTQSYVRSLSKMLYITEPEIYLASSERLDELLLDLNQLIEGEENKYKYLTRIIGLLIEYREDNPVKIRSTRSVRKSESPRTGSDTGSQKQMVNDNRKPPRPNPRTRKNETSPLNSIKLHRKKGAPDAFVGTTLVRLSAYMSSTGEIHIKLAPAS